MSFMSILEKVGHDIKVGLEDALGIEQKLAPVINPFLALINPAFPALLNAGANAVANMEGMAALAGAQNGSGAVKLAAVTSSLATTLGPTLTELGVDPTKVTSTQYTNFINAIVAASNAFITTQAAASSVPAPTPQPVSTQANAAGANLGK